MKCLELFTHKYTSRPGPPYSAKSCPGEKKKGNDGKMYISKPVGSTHRWFELKSFDCTKYVSYERKRRDNAGYYVIDSFLGIEVNPRQILERTTDDRFGNPVFKNSLTTIPKEFRKRKPYQDLCKYKILTNKDMLGKKTLEAHLKSLKKLTIKDYLKIPLGGTSDVIVLHRNWEEDVKLDRRVRGKVYKASSLLKKTTWTLKKTAMLGFEVVKPKMYKTKFMEFDVQYEPGSWYPLKDGFLPGISADNGVKLTKNGQSKHWKQLPRNTPIGFRGAMVFPGTDENVMML